MSLLTAPSSVVVDFYHHGGIQVELAIFHDSLGVRFPDDVSVTDATETLQNDGWNVVRELPGRMLLLGLAEPVTREQLHVMADDLAGSLPMVVRTAGPVMCAPPERPPIILTDEIIVQFHPNVTATTIDSVNQALHAQIVSATDDNRFVVRLVDHRLGDALTVAQLYHESVTTAFAHPNFLGGFTQAAFTPNDLHFPDQWHLHNTGQSGGTADADIDAVEAWDLEQGNSGIIIAIIELDGFDVTHPDFTLWVNPGETSNGVDDGDEFTYVDDINGWNFDGNDANLVGPSPAHGTAVAGLAAAAGNDLGVTGVCRHCPVMLLRAGYAWAGIADAFLYARKMGAAVVNNSWDLWYPNMAVETRITEAATLGRGGSGSVVVFAMPNVPDPLQIKNRCTGIPATGSHPDVVTVASSTDEDVRAFLSPEGSCLDLLAPGVSHLPTSPPETRWGITTTDPVGGGRYNPNHPWTSTAQRCPFLPDLADDAYTNCFGGNSAAAPIVSGVAALVIARNPGLSGFAVRDILRATADKIDAAAAGYSPTPPAPDGFSITHGYGRVNAHRALQQTTKATTCPPTCPSPPATTAVEIGTRMGVTVLNDPVTDRSVVNVPGSGPLSHGVIHVAWFPAPKWTLELQVGGAVTSSSSAPDEREVVAALQPAFLFTSFASGSFYLGLNLAGQLVDVGGVTDTDAAVGGALGYRFNATTFLALRFEGRYRHWFDQSIDEIGIAFAFGVILN